MVIFYDLAHQTEALMNVRTESLAMATEALSVLIVDDHILLGETLVASLGSKPGFDVTAVPGVDSALAAIESHGLFDVVLLDYDLPGENPFNAIGKLIKENSGGVALFSGIAKWGVVDRALDLGVVGFIPKTAHLATLQHAISLIASGSPYLPIEYLRREISDSELALDLRPLEKGVLLRLCKGLTNKEIGRDLDLSEVSVKMHVRTLFGKLGVSNRTQAAIVARQLGFDS